MEYNIGSDAIRWRTLTCIKLITQIFTLALTVFEVLTFEMFDLEILYQV